MAAWSVAGFGGDDAKAMLRVLQALGEARRAIMGLGNFEWQETTRRVLLW